MSGAHGQGTRHASAAARGARWFPAAAGAAALALWASTACRTIAWGDSAELAGAAACFGVPHPPGYPLYTLLTGLLVRAFPADLTALGANVASAAYGAAGVALAVAFLLKLRLGTAACAAAALALVTGRTLWSQAVVAEVYTLDVLLALGALLALARAFEGGGRAWFWAGLVAGLWVGHRWVNAAYVPGLVLIAWGIRGRRGAFAAGPLALGLAAAALPCLYLPIASSMQPPIDIGDPERWDRFLTVVTSAPYVRHVGSGTLAAQRMLRYVRELPQELGLLAFAAPLGVWWLARRAGGGAVAAGCVLLAGVCVAATSRYEIPDFRVYYIPSFLAIGVLGAAGAQAVLAWLGRAGPRAGRWAAVCLVAASATGLPLHLSANDLRAERSARVYGEHMLECAPADAVLLVAGDTAAHVLWYLQAVEGRAPRTVVVSMGHWTDWYFDALARRHPEDPWPDLRSGDEPREQLSRLLEAMSPGRPIVFALDPAPLALPGALWWGTRTVVPVGILTEARVRDAAFDRDALARWDAAFWERAVLDLGATRPAADPAVKAIYIEYALGLVRCGDFLARRGMGEGAARLYRAALALEPERWEDEILRERPGPRAAPLRVGAMARAGLAGLLEEAERSLAPSGGS